MPFTKFVIGVATIMTVSSLAWLAIAQRPGASPAKALPHVSPIRVLFLGDHGPHRPAERAKQLLPYLASRGIDARFSTDQDELNDRTLADVDVLLLYANDESITPEQELALIRFVNNGGGFVPVHCASYCYHNSPKYTELVGAQFKSHSGEVFKARISAAEHPAMLGLTEFSSWDETYVHHRHNEDRTILMVREKTGEKPEPYTWTREVGEGRVFYTALGHDERTWGEISFLRLLENGIRWAAKREGTIQAASRRDLPPLAHVPAGAPIPFYPPSDKWGVQAEPLKEMQAPLSPAESLKYLELPDGFRAELFAAEPDIVKVIAMTWDPRGRLWVAETVDYPNDLQPPGKGNDRIKICEDTNGDGKADKFTVFADQLSIPTSLVVANGGLIVAQAPDMLFLQDIDGDDRADVRRVLFTGWKTNDTHAGPNNLHYGFDNWIWGIVGYAGFEGTVGVNRMRFGQGVFRFRPDGAAMEFVTSLSNNAWGLGFSETGEIFASTANNDHSVHVAIPNRYYEAVRGWSGRGSASIAESQRYYPITEHHRQMDWHGRFTAAAGHALYTARAFPKWYWNRVSFITEGTGHLIHNDVLEPHGSTFIARNAYNFAASHDEWTSPVAAEVGPDGAVWVSDWYNYIFQHNPTPHGFETGKGNAYVTPLRDKVHGRVYRIVYEGAPRVAAKRLDKATPDQLLAVLNDDNLFWRLTAQRLLVERGLTFPDEWIESLAKDTRIDQIGNSPAAMHALRTLEGIRFETNASRGALTHPVAAVRKAALANLRPTDQSTGAILKANLLNDPDAQVRLAAMLALADVQPSDAAGAAIAAAMEDPRNARDRWIPDAATAAAARNAESFMRSVLATRSSREKPASQPAMINLVGNSSFEERSGTAPAGWKQSNWQGSADAVVERVDGQDALRITANADQGADSSLSARVLVEANTDYRLTARIRTRGVRKGSGLGALVNVHELTSPVRVATDAVTGTSPWTMVCTSFNSGEHRQLTINCLLGGWGKSFGTAWFDDVRLEPVDLPDDILLRVLRVVATHYAFRATPESIAVTLENLRGTDDVTISAMLDGLLAGWPSELAYLNRAEDEKRHAIWRESAKGMSADNRARLVALARRFGTGGNFDDVSAVVRKELMASIADEKLDSTSRLDDAKRLLALADNVETVKAFLNLISPQSEPSLAVGLVSALANSRVDATGGMLLAKWESLPPAVRKTAIDVLLRRSAWHAAMLDALEKGKLTPGDLTAEQKQQLVAVAADDAASTRAAEFLAAGRPADAERQKVIDQLMRVADVRGDVASGKAAFEKNCAVCHQFAGVGGRVGPDLTGVGKNPRHEILLNIIDPNRSVEGNFKLWIVQTKDGQTISGRLDTETQTTVELLDAAGKQHVVQRKEIRRMVSKPTSIMPEGFELLPEKDLADLLEFLTQPVESPK